jgi:hypothetical protein
MLKPKTEKDVQKFQKFSEKVSKITTCKICALLAILTVMITDKDPLNTLLKIPFPGHENNLDSVFDVLKH